MTFGDLRDQSRLAGGSACPTKMQTTPVKPLLAVVGGFLGAGKTTLILTAAGLLQQRGLRVAAILNDQGDDLVDTHYAGRHGIACDQVTGGCFCCRFPDLV